MRIKNININGFLGARNVNVATESPIILFAGDNESGKSSTYEAITLAFIGEMARVNLKREYQQTVTDGMSEGVIHVRTDMGGSSFELPSGKWGEDLSVDKFPMRYVLKADRFSLLDQKERRRLLMNLSGISLKPEEIAERLVARGIQEDVVKAIVPHLKDGFDRAAVAASDEARELKGSWREITGEQWGAKKAESWGCSAPAFDQDAAANASAKLQSAEALRDEARENRDRIRGARDAAVDMDQRIQGITEQLNNRDDIESRALKAERDVEKWRVACGEYKSAIAALDDEIEKIPVSSGSPAAVPEPEQIKPLTGFNERFERAMVDDGQTLKLGEINSLISPMKVTADGLAKLGVESCGKEGNAVLYRRCDVVRICFELSCILSLVAHNHSAPTAGDGHELAEDYREELETLHARRSETVSMFSSAEENFLQAETDASEAQRALAALDGKSQLLMQLQVERRQIRIDDRDIEEADAQFNAAETQVQSWKATADEHERNRKAADEATIKTNRAAALHAQIVSWTDAADALSPNGIPAEIVAETLEPINKSLATASQQSGWPAVTIDADMAIRCGGRLYDLCSESQKWRADAMIAAMIAHVSGVGFLMLDRLDVNSIPHRVAAMKWMHTALTEGFITGAIMFGTLKELPTGLPPEFHTVWLDKGKSVSANDPQDEAA